MCILCRIGVGRTMGMKSEKRGETADNWPDRSRSVKSRGQFARIANLAPTSLPPLHPHAPPSGSLFNGPVDEGDENLAGNIWMTRSFALASLHRAYDCTRAFVYVRIGAKKIHFFFLSERTKKRWVGRLVIVRFYLNAYRDSPGLQLTMRGRKWNFDYDRSLPTRVCRISFSGERYAL